MCKNIKHTVAVTGNSFLELSLKLESFLFGGVAEIAILSWSIRRRVRPQFLSAHNLYELIRVLEQKISKVVLILPEHDNDLRVNFV